MSSSSNAKCDDADEGKRKKSSTKGGRGAAAAKGKEMLRHTLHSTDDRVATVLPVEAVGEALSDKQQQQ